VVHVTEVIKACSAYSIGVSWHCKTVDYSGRLQNELNDSCAKDGFCVPGIQSLVHSFSNFSKTISNFRLFRVPFSLPPYFLLFLSLFLLPLLLSPSLPLLLSPFICLVSKAFEAEIQSHSQNVFPNMPLPFMCAYGKSTEHKIHPFNHSKIYNPVALNNLQCCEAITLPSSR
jgi:hypothetical protein